jgi:hypothetical protein
LQEIAAKDFSGRGVNGEKTDPIAVKANVLENAADFLAGEIQEWLLKYLGEMN